MEDVRSFGYPLQLLFFTKRVMTTRLMIEIEPEQHTFEILQCRLDVVIPQALRDTVQEVLQHNATLAVLAPVMLPLTQLLDHQGGLDGRAGPGGRRVRLPG